MPYVRTQREHTSITANAPSRCNDDLAAVVFQLVRKARDDAKLNRACTRIGE